MTRRLLNGLAAGVLCLVLAIVAVLWALLGTQAGSRWLLAQVPGLQVDSFAGRLGGAWRADSLLWQQGETRVVLQQVDMAWSPLCLLRLPQRIALEARGAQLEPHFGHCGADEQRDQPHGHAIQAQAVDAFDIGPGELLGFVIVRSTWGDLLASEDAHGLQQQRFMLRQAQLSVQSFDCIHAHIL